VCPPVEHAVVVAMATHAVTPTAAILDNEMGRRVTHAMKEPRS
jgi:hypothetical protein